MSRPSVITRARGGSSRKRAIRWGPIRGMSPSVTITLSALRSADAPQRSDAD
jgi:hypothetical protein